MIVNGFCKQVFKELPMEFGASKRKSCFPSKEMSSRVTIISSFPAATGGESMDPLPEPAGDDV